MNTIEEFKKHLQSTLDADFLFCTAEHEPPSERLVSSVERRLNVTFSAEFRAFQRIYGGAYLEVSEETWPRPTKNQVGPFWTFNYACNIFGVGDGIPDALNIEVANARLQEEASGMLPFPLYPVFEWVIGNGNLVCLDKAGVAFEWTREMPGEPEPLHQSFLDFLASQFTQLAEYKKQMIGKNDRNA